MDKYKKYC